MNAERKGVGRGVILGVLLRSFTIQGSRNYLRLQNIGFAYSLLPLVKNLARDRQEAARMLTRHVRLFHTNPYMSGPIIGSVVNIEEARFSGGDCPEADELKEMLMAPYSGIGDSLFWGALKPFSSIIGVLLAIKGCLIAPAALLLIYNPLHLWVRVRGYYEGCRKGREAVEFVRGLSLPQVSQGVRWLSVVSLGALAAVLARPIKIPLIGFDFVESLIILAGIAGCFLLIRRDVSVVAVIYGIFAVLIIFNL